MSLHIFEVLFDYFISWLYMFVLKLFLGKILFFCKFSSSFIFSVWNVRTDLLLFPNMCGSDIQMVKWHVWTRVVLPIANLAVDHLDECVTHPDTIPTGIFWPLPFQANHTSLYFYWFIMLCCVFFSQIFPKILAFFAHLFSFYGICYVFLCSFMFLCFLEYWNICWLESFLEILCMKILLCLCVRLILIYLGHLDCDVCFCNSWASNWELL
jgi:hypothetical protein